MMHLEKTFLKRDFGRRLVAVPTLMVLLAISGCSQPAPLREPPPPEAQPTVNKADLPHAVLPDGFVIDLELAITPQEVADGLMYRPSLRENKGMLFLFQNDRYPSFWMKNTLIPLDIVFLDGSGVVVDVAARVPPCAADPCPTYSPKGPARAVVELAAGTAEAHGITPGASIAFTGVAGFPVPTDEDEPPA